MFVSFDQNFNFQVIGKQVEPGETYVGVGLSFDAEMVLSYIVTYLHYQ